MIKDQMKLILLLILFTSCANLKDVKTYQSGEDFYKFKTSHKTPLKEHSLRKETGELVFNDKEAKEEIMAATSLNALKKRIPSYCSEDYELAELYHEIIDALSSKKSEIAINKISIIIKECPAIEKRSHINYLQAYAHHLKSDDLKRDQYLKDFINNAESIFPLSLSQEDKKQERVVLYNQYKEHAKEVLAGAEFKVELTTQEHLSMPRYRSLKNSSLPGFKSDTGRYFYILPGYSTATKGYVSAMYNISTDYGEFIPFISINDLYGTLGTLVYRKQLSQTIDRRHQTGINLNLHQWKKITYEKTYYGSFENSKTQDSGIGARFGYGGTYQLTNDFHFVYQGSYFSNYTNNLTATTLLGYNITTFSQLQFGLLKDHSVIVYKVGVFYFIKNFSRDEVNFNLGGVFQF
jgi:hypothetical protein